MLTTHRLSRSSASVVYAGLLTAGLIGSAYAEIIDGEVKCSRVRGRAVSQVIPPPACNPFFQLCIEGEINGGLRGDLTSTIFKFIPPLEPTIPNVRFYVGKTEIRTRQGDILIGTESGALDLQAGVGAAVVTWTQGTGRYAGASGHIQVNLNLDPDTDIVVSKYDGRVCIPK